MYKLFLCLRYLRTRYLAFVCIVSVTLGVATLIVVNSVMSGFSEKLKTRLHGVLADVLLETERSEGFDEHPERLVARVKDSPAGNYVEATSPTVEVFALLQFHVRDKHGRKVPITKHVRLIGIEPERHAKVGRFSEYLVRQKDSPAPSFALTPTAEERFARNQQAAQFDDPLAVPFGPRVEVPAGPQPGDFLKTPPVENPNPPSLLPPPEVPAGPPPRVPGVILGYSIAHFRYTDPATQEVHEVDLLRPGDDVQLMTLGTTMKPVSATFVVADFFKSEMSEYDSSFVYVPLDELQRMRGMDGRVNALQMKLRAGLADDTEVVHGRVVPQLQALFPPAEGTRVISWQQHQGPLLQAIDIERGILNLLLFMIVGVAGFSVLAIFTMIVSEKYRDIGVLKSLGASNRGVMGIFLGYGLLLGLIGSLLGTAAGLAITHYINEIEAFLTHMTGHQVFDRSVYYFDKIPTNVEPLTVLLVNVGAVGTAVVFSILPAWRAARLHPVRALRFE